MNNLVSIIKKKYYINSKEIVKNYNSYKKEKKIEKEDWLYSEICNYYFENYDSLIEETTPDESKNLLKFKIFKNLKGNELLKTMCIVVCEPPKIRQFSIKEYYEDEFVWDEDDNFCSKKLFKLEKEINKEIQKLNKEGHFGFIPSETRAIFE